MAYDVTLPRLGWDMEEGSLASWLKQEGEFVKRGELLFTVEGDKAIQEIEALDTGYLRILPDGPQPGVKVPVGTLLGYLVPESERDSFKFPGSDSKQHSTTAAWQDPPTMAVPEAAVPPDVLDAKARRIYISPYAKRLAEGLSVDWERLQGSGRAGRIMAADVEKAAAQPVTQKPDRVAIPKPPPAPLPAIPGMVTRQPMSQTRKKIAEHMAASAHTVAPVTLTAEVDATEMVTLRKQLKADAALDGLPVPSYNDMLAKIAAQALLEHPHMNAQIVGDEILFSNSAHIAVAVDTERGLLVPVLRDVQAKSLRQVAREAAALIEKTRQGTVAYADLQGATFTITNLGMFEIEAFTPIIDLPQCAILGVGQIIAKQVVTDAELELVEIRQRMVLSLTFDHRLVDGAQAARFLQRIKRLVERPYVWLVGS
ncbi:MAG TPA: dihydrolipoamide acetyltransferase family protein [Anaerolineales bacterium]|nr:dihydrolipoamide acetyltransferase family protein [Anaerolineales bacterium]